MRKDAHSETLSLLARRIEEAQMALGIHLREVARLSRLVTTLRAEFNEITNQAALIELLPDEVLAAVFETGCLLRDRKVLRRFGRPFELLVCSVSRRWRNVAISTPTLWREITILHGQPLDLVGRYLSRSGILSLDIQADLRCDSHSYPSTRLFLRTVLPQIGRWRSMSIYVNQSRDLYTLFRRIHSATAPVLESLHVSFESKKDEDEGDADADAYDEDALVIDVQDNEITDEDEDDDDDDEEIDHDTIVTNILLGGTPALRTFRLKGIGLHNCVPPGSTLTALHVHSAFGEITTTRNQFRDILDNLSSLTHLAIYGHVTGHDSSSTRPSLLPMLRVIHLLPDDRYPSQTSLLAIISAPLLDCLILQQVSSRDIHSLSRDPEWGTPSRYPSLRSLTVRWNHSYFEESTWKCLLRLFPTIVEFTLWQPPGCSFIRAFGQGAVTVEPVLPPVVPWWPSLQILSLARLHPTELTSLSSVLSSRISQGYPLHKLRLWYCPSQESQEKQHFVEKYKHIELEQVHSKETPYWCCDDVDQWLYDRD